MERRFDPKGKCGVDFLRAVLDPSFYKQSSQAVLGAMLGCILHVPNSFAGSTDLHLGVGAGYVFNSSFTVQNEEKPFGFSGFKAVMYGGIFVGKSRSFRQAIGCNIEYISLNGEFAERGIFEGNIGRETAQSLGSNAYYYGARSFGKRIQVLF